MNKLFSANYMNADSNFKIYNLKPEEKDNRFFSVLCLVQNLLQRGLPTDLSMYLREYYKVETSDECLHLVADSVPNWGTVIKGEDSLNEYPARNFYYDIVPKEFQEYPFLQNIMIPEVYITDIVKNAPKRFTEQQVDFYVPQIRLVIEIDGTQHMDYLQKRVDDDRDELFRSHGIHTVRIPTGDLKDKSKRRVYIDRIKKRLKEYDRCMLEYRNSYEKCMAKSVDKELSLIATIRLQIAIIQMCLSGMLSLDEKQWTLYIKNHEVGGYEYNAIEDLFLWIEKFCCMANIPFSKPDVIFEERSSLEEVEPSNTRIEMSLLEKWTEQNSYNDWVYVYTDWFQDVDYFKICTAEPIVYDFYHDEYADEKEYSPKRQALRFVLKNLFGFDTFRPGQERIIINALQGRDTIGILPTGSGKSLCYQMCVMMQPCISFCVCPIKSLMLDQVYNIKGHGVTRTAFISSDYKNSERMQIQEDFYNGKYWLLYLAPERFQLMDFRKYLSGMSADTEKRFAYAVIDEVHCMSEWGHDFRVAYLNLIKTIKRFCSKAVLFGLTATASYNVLKNILVEFEMPDKSNVISLPSFTRPELNFKVIKCSDESEEYRGKEHNEMYQTDKRSKLNELLDNYLRMFPSLLDGKSEVTRCGIIFTPYVIGDYGCYTLACRLREKYSKRIEFFSGKKPDKMFPPVWWKEGLLFEDYKREIQAAFSNDEYSLLCATKAFGMGIDKPNIRYTIHYGIPSSLEALYQEAGRAGRDREKATCTILYSPEPNEVHNEVKKMLAPDSDISQIKKYLDDNESWHDNDLLRQLRLLGGGLVPLDDEKREVTAMLEKYIKPGVKGINIEANRRVEKAFDHLQKYVYHLSVIGVIEDWTLDYSAKSVLVDVIDYSEETVLAQVEKYIRNYETDYIIKEDTVYLEEVQKTNQSFEITALSVFWNWYYKNIIYSRKQALNNILDACESYSADKANEFKEKMEAYFHLDDVADMLGVVADEPREINRWFDVINVDMIRKKKVSHILMGLSRFLESYQHNIGLNYISGFMNLLENNFESLNGRDRMQQAFASIEKFTPEDRWYILNETTKVMNEIGNPEVQEIFAEFYIDNYPLDEVDRHIYNIQGDNYSLNSYIRRILSYMINEIGETEDGKS